MQKKHLTKSNTLSFLFILLIKVLHVSLFPIPALMPSQHPFFIKTLSKVGIPHHNKNLYDKPTANIIHTGQQQKHFP